MSVSVTVSVESAATAASVRAITMAMRDKPGLHGAMAEGVARLTRAHLRDNYLPRDRDGVDFWADVIRSIEATAGDAEATVTLQEVGLRLRYHGSAGLPGGGVTPGKSISSYTGKPTRALAIPTEKVPAAGGRRIRPGLAGLLAFVRSAQGGETVGFLVEGMEKALTRGRNKGAVKIVPKPGGSLLYVLRTITRHRPDHGILPPEARISEAALRAVGDFVESFVE